MLASVAPAPAHAQAGMCPPELQADEAHRGPVPDGWQLAQQLRVAARRLEGLELYAGHPDQMAALVPDRSVRKGQQRVSTWRLPAAEPGTDTDSNPNLYWLACTYANSLLQFVRPLPAAVRQCVLTERLNKAGSAVAIESLDCR